MKSEDIWLAIAPLFALGVVIGIVYLIATFGRALIHA